MLLRQTLLYLPSQFAGPAMQFVFAIVWTHWLTQKDYGLLTLLIASQELIFLCCVSWWSLYVLRFFGGAASDDAKALRGAEPRVLQAIMLPQIVFNVGVIWSLGWIGDAEIVCSSIGYVMGRSLVTYFGERVRTEAKILLYTLAQTGSLAAGGLIGFLLVAFVAPTAASVLTGFAISHLLVAWWLVRRLEISGATGRLDAALLKRALAFGLPLVVAGAINWVNLNSIRFIVEIMGGTTAVGLLAVGWGLGQRLSTTVAMFVTTAAFPLAAKSLERGATEKAMQQMRHGGTLLVGLVAPAAAGICAITPPFVDLVIAAEFREVTLLIMPMAVITGAVRNMRVHYADMAFILFERTNRSVLVNSVEAAAMVTLCAAGYLLHGIAGAVAGAMIASSAAALFGFVLASRMGLPIPLADWGRIGMATGLMMFAVVLCDRLLPFASPLARIVIESGLGAGIYSAAIAGLFPAQVRGVLSRLRKPRTELAADAASAT